MDVKKEHLPRSGTRGHASDPGPTDDSDSRVAGEWTRIAVTLAHVVCQKKWQLKKKQSIDGLHMSSDSDVLQIFSCGSCDEQLELQSLAGSLREPSYPQQTHSAI